MPLRLGGISSRYDRIPRLEGECWVPCHIDDQCLVEDIPPHKAQARTCDRPLLRRDLSHRQSHMLSRRTDGADPLVEVLRDAAGRHQHGPGGSPLPRANGSAVLHRRAPRQGGRQVSAPHVAALGRRQAVTAAGKTAGQGAQA